LFLLVGTVSAQATLVPNVTRTNEHLGLGSESYVADLDAGHWTVVLSSDSFWGLEVLITVSRDLPGLDVIAVSGNGTGHFPVVDFTLTTNETVYIRVRDNTVYATGSGFFDIGVYDDSHIPGFFDLLRPFDWIVLIGVVSILLMICCIGFSVRRARRGVRTMQESIAVQAPMHIIPQKYQGSVQRHGSETTTVRLPLKCPSCGAEVSHENVDWVGPLEARCSYCGATMRATFERI
jgi:hypothetical protein